MALGVWVNAVRHLGALVKQSKNERKGNETFFQAYSPYPSISPSSRNVGHQCLVLVLVGQACYYAAASGHLTSTCITHARECLTCEYLVIPELCTIIRIE